MSLQIRVKHRPRLGLLLAAALAGAGILLPLAADALPRDADVASFAAQSRGADSLRVTPADEATTWSGAESADFGDGFVAPDIYRSGGDHLAWDSARSASFATYARPRHGGNGGGWGDHGELDDDDHGHGRCDDGCVNTSAVPEPTRAGLLIAGAFALIILVKRRRGSPAL